MIAWISKGELAFCPGYVWGGWHLWRASQTVAGDLDAAQQRRGGAALPVKEIQREHGQKKVSIAQ